MGHWTKLAIGDVTFHWKYQIPTFLTFLFAEDEVIVEYEPEEAELDEDLDLDEDVDDELDEPEDPWPTKIGYRTTAAAARGVLDGHGYTIEFLAGIYDSFRPDLDAEVRFLVEEALLGEALMQAESSEDIEEAIQRKVDDHFSASSGTPLDDLKAFRSFLQGLGPVSKSGM